MAQSESDQTQPLPARGRTGPDAPRAPATVITSSFAVRREQSERTRAVLVAAIFVSALTLLTWLLPGVATRSPAELPANASLAAVIAVSAALLVVYRAPRLLPERAVAAFGVVATTAILAATYYVGVFSAAVMAAFVTLYYFALGDSARTAWSVYLALAVGYAGVALLYVLDAGDARLSMFALDRPKPIPMIALTVVVEAYLGLTFWLGRSSRRSTLDAMARLESAHRQIRQREALLNEARADLDREIDAGRLGRLTGLDVGPFRAEEVVGRGAMGEVYRAVHRETSAEHALKVLHPFVASDRAHAERFFREARISTGLDSPHIVRTSESGVLDDGSAWLAMELLTGRDLASLLRRRGRLGAGETVDLVAQVARGLEVARRAGVVHRDVKPQNLFLADSGPSPVWKILDFGISTIELADGSLTRGAAIGTPSYMSPEQTRGQPVDHRSDVFALGAIAYRALTGRPAFTGADPMQTMYNVAHVMPTRPGVLVRAHEDVDRAFALALAKDREDRFASATAFAEALRDAVGGQLADEVRAAADRLVAAHGWGPEVEETPRSAPTRP